MSFERKLVHLIAGARPNFMKIAPVYHALKEHAWLQPCIVHTGQHYDRQMSGSFFEELGLPEPHINLEVGSGTHAVQTARVMIAYEEALVQSRPDLVLVVGDVNSTLACALVAAKLHIPVAHLEAGLRSGDMTMPEEVNRKLTDQISDILWTPSRDGDENLKREGIAPEKIEFVGNIMIDSLEMMRPQFETLHVAQSHGLSPKQFGLVTLHRPANVDFAEPLSELVNALTASAKSLPLLFPVHPRTAGRLKEFGLLSRLAESPAITIAEPLPYAQFMNLVANARAVITDSGGIQEEATHLGVACLTLRDSTERPITVTHGTNRLCTPSDLPRILQQLVQTPCAPPQPIELWDGKTAARVVRSLERFFG